MIRGKRVLVIEDGPTLTHGEMKIGAGGLLPDVLVLPNWSTPRPYIVGKLKKPLQPILASEPFYQPWVTENNS
jgi:predicted GTPase